MGKIDTKKKLKQNAIFQTSFDLFREKGFAKTTISDIVKNAGLAKGTFYLYFKDKYDLRDKLISHKTSQLFLRAHQALMQNPVEGFENQLLFVLDYIIDILEHDKGLLQFISKNLSWGIFKKAINAPLPEDSKKFYEYFKELMEKNQIKCLHLEQMLFSIVELVGSTCYSCILFEEPTTMQDYLPHLHEIIHHILIIYTQPSSQEPLPD